MPDKLSLIQKKKFNLSFSDQFNIYGAMKGHVKNRRNNRRFSSRKRRQIGIKS